MNQELLNRSLPDEPALEQFAAEFAANLRAPLTVYLEGPLGAGKTTFVRALLRALGYAGRVKSPTYGLLETYELPAFQLIHLDLYRVEDAAELDYLAIRDQVDDATVLMIEWAAKGGQEIPPADVVVRFSDSILQRELTAIGHSKAGRNLLFTISG